MASLLRWTLTTLTFAVCVVQLLAADDSDKKKSKKKTADDASPVIAHLKLSGGLDETPTAADPLFGSGGENFKAKLDRLAKAKADAKVVSVVLELGDLSIGWGKLDELRRAIAGVRGAGKKVHAYAESVDTKTLLAGLACDTFAMPPSGELMMAGLRAEVMFYKDFFEKFHLQADFLQMGDFKGAAEPYMRNSMSPQFRKQFESVIDDFYEKSLVAAIVASRPNKNWTQEQVKKLIDEGAFTAKRAHEIGLVDFLGYQADLEAKCKADGNSENAKLVRDYAKEKQEDVDLSNPFAIFKLLAPSKPKTTKGPKIAVVYAVGAITTGRGTADFLGEGAVGSTTMVEAIREAQSDDTVKAIVLRVDSPGGSALASDLIWNELSKCKKPVVASMGDVAASGGYYISMAARRIYAEPGTLTGSIGVVGGKIVTGRLFNWLGLKTEVISRGANSGLLSSEQPWSESERGVMLKLMQDTYDQFLDKALEGRKKAGVAMDREKLLTLAGGRIWTGRQAKAAGLVDELGALDDAIAGAKKLAGMDGQDCELLILPHAKSFIERLADTADLKAPALTAELLPIVQRVPELRRPLRTAAALLQLRNERVWLIAPYQFEVK
jgi:protease IV